VSWHDLHFPADFHEVGKVGGDVWLLAEPTCDIDDPRLPYLLTMTVTARKGRLVCGALTLRARPDGPPVTLANVRSVPIESYLREVSRYLWESRHPALMRKAEELPGAFDSLSDKDVKVLEAGHRRRQPTAEVLPKVVAAYRSALSSKDPFDREAPTAAVARQLGYSRGHVARLLTAARREGLLGPAHRGRSGESIN